MGDTFILDNGGRRSNIERRKFSYTNYFPERRSGEDRRFSADRRKERYAEREGPERRFVL
ncbi:MAG: hypothetical protein MUO43_09140 [Desulfobacterales bacterium]|nr:hypothetical protein [Desulfobacterales bacterium]